MQFLKAVRHQEDTLNQDSFIIVVLLIHTGRIAELVDMKFLSERLLNGESP